MSATITLQELKQLKQPYVKIIDIRSQQEFLKGHAPDAVNIPYDVLMMYPESYLKRDETYYLICDYGSISHRASVILQSYGYQVFGVKNGYQVDMRYYC